MRRLLLTALAFVVSLVAASSAQALAVRDAAATSPGHAYGVALVPGTKTTATRTALAHAGIAPITASGACTDPVLPVDLSVGGVPGALPGNALCLQSGGSVMHENETFALTWDPARQYWQTTRNYMEQFLRDVANGSNTLTSPYAVTSQYVDKQPNTDPGTTNPFGQAANHSQFGGGCIDFGPVGGFTCKFGTTTATGSGGDDYPAGNDCSVSGTNQFYEAPDGTFGNAPNTICVTDADVQAELQKMIPQMGLTSRAKAGYTPLVVLLTPPGVELCLDGSTTLCSANGTPTTPFCSYHSQVVVNINGAPVNVAYIVQPWTASWHIPTGCDEPDVTPIPDPPTPSQIATGVGQRLVSPLSQAHIASILNPSFSGWYRQDGSEINDNGCAPLNNQRDSVTVGSASYYLQREFNNGGAIQTDPNSPLCAPSVQLSPTFVVPSAVEPGDVVQFDGSTTVSSLIVPKLAYRWNYGDGTTDIGPSVAHLYTKAGTYTVTLTVIDRGGNVASANQTIVVLGTTGNPVTIPPGSHGKTKLHARLQLVPQGLRAMLRSGLAVRVSSNLRADGIATLSMSRKAAKRAGIRSGRGVAVIIARGTVSGLKNGTANLHLHVSRAIAKKLARLKHVTLTVRLMLVSAGGSHFAIDAAGHY